MLCILFVLIVIVFISLAFYLPSGRKSAIKLIGLDWVVGRHCYLAASFAAGTVCTPTSGL